MFQLGNVLTARAACRYTALGIQITIYKGLPLPNILIEQLPEPDRKKLSP